MAGQRNNFGKRTHFQSDSAANGGSKRRNPGDDSEQYGIGSEDTVYRYLCPLKKIGSIIGKGGEIIKQLRSETKANIRISETIPGCDERIITIYSSSEETNLNEDSGEFVTPAEDALFRVHDRIVAEDVPSDDEDEFGEVQQSTIRMLVPADQIGCVIGKGGQVVQNIRNETHAQIRILKDEFLPLCALSFDELLQIVGEPSVVRKALFHVATRLHENPSRSQHLLLSSSSSIYQSTGVLLSAPLMGPYGNYSARRDEASANDFSLRFVCPFGNIGGVIGKGGAIIKQIRQESGASIKVDSSGADGDDCIIFISTKEYYEDPSPTIIAALRLQPRCSEKAERESGDPVITTRILAPSSQVGCLIGRGGAIISEMRNATRASIRIFSKENLPKVAGEDEEMVQITGPVDVASNALLQVLLRLRADVFDRDAAMSTYPPVLPYVPMSTDMSDGSKYGNRDSQSRGRGYATYGSGDIPPSDSYGSYGAAMSGGASLYGAYGGRSSGRGSSGPSSQRKNHGY